MLTFLDSTVYIHTYSMYHSMWLCVIILFVITIGMWAKAEPHYAAEGSFSKTSSGNRAISYVTGGMFSVL